jgi:hypothetical protein
VLTCHWTRCSGRLAAESPATGCDSPHGPRGGGPAAERRADRRIARRAPSAPRRARRGHGSRDVEAARRRPCIREMSSMCGRPRARAWLGSDERATRCEPAPARAPLGRRTIHKPFLQRTSSPTAGRIKPRPILVCGAPPPVRKRPLKHCARTLFAFSRPPEAATIRANPRAFVSRKWRAGQ